MGTFTFELSITAAKAIGFKMFYDERILSLTIAFLKSYCDGIQTEYNREVWERVIMAEKKRAKQVLSFYIKFWKNDNWFKEMFRGIGLGTYVLMYRVFGLFILNKRVNKIFS